MKRDDVLKTISFGLSGLMMAILTAATVSEKIYGSGFSYEHLYTSPWSILVWAALAVTSLAYLISRKVWRHAATFCLHLSFIVILAGAMVTHVFGEQGRMHLRTGSGNAVTGFVTSGGKTCSLPFEVSLKDFSLECHKGTSAPMDYVSTIVIRDGSQESEAVVSMNNIHRYRNYRFYQSGFDRDRQGVTLAVSHDPWGIGITYAGYMLLLASMVAFFFGKGSRFRALLRHPSLKKAVCAVILAGSLASPDAAAKDGVPRTISREAAEAFGDLYIYYNDRICPLQTFAKDFTVKLCGKPSYKGLTSEQVLAGWFFHYDCWKTEPMIKIKGADAKAVLGISGNYAALTDFIDGNVYKPESALLNMDGDNIRNILAANEKFNLIGMVCSGSMLKIYPFGSEGSSEAPVWYSLCDSLPSDMGYEERMFVTGSMDYVAEKAAADDSREVIHILKKIREYQAIRGGGFIPSETLFRAEQIYDSFNWNKPLAMLCLTLGILSFLLFCLSGRPLRGVRAFLTVVCAAVFAYLTFHIGLRWYVSGHVPLSNGFETMQFMAWCCLLLCLFIRKRFGPAQPLALLICGAALLVSMMGEANPRITRLMPVLQSPLLSIHVMVIMLSYVLFAFMMLNGVAALILNASRREDAEEMTGYLRTVSNLMLYPAVFLLTAGIFIGAVWANVSWGRYWGWDPKEVWALITMMIYSLGLHQKSLKWFSRPMNFHIFCIMAFLSVIITYFGVNFILGGLHSYA